MELILTAMLGVIPDETMTSLMALNLVDFLNLSKEELMTYPGIGSSMAARLMAAFALTNFNRNIKHFRGTSQGIV